MPLALKSKKIQNMKRQCDVCLALVTLGNHTYSCALGKIIKPRQERNGLGVSIYPAPAEDCPKPVTRKAFAREMTKQSGTLKT
jgi:hypothetical protein